LKSIIIGFFYLLIILSHHIRYHFSDKCKLPCWCSQYFFRLFRNEFRKHILRLIFCKLIIIWVYPLYLTISEFLINIDREIELSCCFFKLTCRNKNISLICIKLNSARVFSFSLYWRHVFYLFFFELF
jgi:hypothetical protein